MNTYLATYLFFFAHRAQPHTRPLNRTLAAVFITLNVLTAHQLLLATSENLLVDTTNMLRGAEVIVLMYFSCRLVYMVLGTTTNRFATEQETFRRSFTLLLAIELLIVAVHVSSTFGTEIPAPRPSWLNFPLVVSQTWLIVLLARAWRTVARRPTHQSHWQTLWRPEDPSARLLRDMAVAAAITPLVTLVFLVPALQQAPLWVRNLSNPTLLLSGLIVTLSYLRHYLRDVGLELRVIAGALLFFLVLTSTLGQLISATFVRLELPDVPIEAVVGSVSDVRFMLEPAYRPTAMRLHQLLLPVLWFQIGGSAFFALGYRFYYRSQIQQSINTIVEGIEQLESGNLAYRIQESLPDEMSVIASALNTLAETALNNINALVDQQRTLEQTVAERTAALAAEMSARRNSEMQQAVLEERLRIGRDAHDGVLQNLYAVRMWMRGRSLRLRLPDTTFNELQLIADRVQASIRELRAMIDDTTTPWHKLTLSEAACRIVTLQEQTYGIPTRLVTNSVLPTLIPDQHIAVLRIIQEAVSNIGRHSAATTATLTLTFAPECNLLTVQIDDDGIGFDSRDRTSNQRGVTNMHSRAEEIGATLKLRPNPHCEDPQRPGTRLILTLPLSQHAKDAGNNSQNLPLLPNAPRT